MQGLEQLRENLIVGAPHEAGVELLLGRQHACYVAVFGGGPHLFDGLAEVIDLGLAGTECEQPAGKSFERGSGLIKALGLVRSDLGNDQTPLGDVADQTFGFQPPSCFTDDPARDDELVAELSFNQAIAGLYFARRDHFSNGFDDLLSERSGDSGYLPRFWFDVIHSLATVGVRDFHAGTIETLVFAL